MEIEKKIEDYIRAMNFPILNKQIITEKSIKKIECEIGRASCRERV